MKIRGILIVYAFVAALPTAFFDSNADEAQSVNGAVVLGQHSRVPKLETIKYNWEDFGIDVSFTKLDGDSLWGVTIRDSWDILEQSKEPGKAWGPSVSKCSCKECLRLIDRSLQRFHSEKPGSQFKYVAIEMQLIRELWSEIQTGLGQKMLTMVESKSSDSANVPSEIEDELRHLLDDSTTVDQIKTLLQKHGMDAHEVSVSDDLLFKTSLNGQKWSEIAALPGLGIDTPGVFEFTFGKSDK
jgi:hypothetical protein